MQQLFEGGRLRLEAESDRPKEKFNKGKTRQVNRIENDLLPDNLMGSTSEIIIYERAVRDRSVKEDKRGSSSSEELVDTSDELIELNGLNVNQESNRPGDAGPDTVNTQDTQGNLSQNIQPKVIHILGRVSEESRTKQTL